jgi:hypothetical protein
MVFLRGQGHVLLDYRLNFPHAGMQQALVASETFLAYMIEPGGQPSGQPQAQLFGSAARRATASVRISGRLQNANRTRCRPACSLS